MFVPQKHVDPDAEGTSPIIPRGRKQCIPHSGQAISGGCTQYGAAIVLAARRQLEFARRVAKLEREIDRLFELPLNEFTSRRNELARRLKGEGDEEGSKRVRALAKPSVPAWAINQLARQEKQGIKELLDSGAKLRKAQERALAGRHSDELRIAQVEERQALRDLTRRAEQILAEGGRPATPAVLTRVSATLGAAAVTEPARAELKAGRLTRELKVSGFEALAGVEVPAQAPAAGRDELAERRQRKSDRERRRRQLQKKTSELQSRAGAAEEEADRAEEAASKARETADKARQAADDAASELADFEKGAPS
jgi:hypothetical protein